MFQVRFRDPAGQTRVGRWTDDTVSFGGTTYTHDEIEILPPVEPTKLICVGLNYADHAAELDLAVPERPTLFMKPPNTVAGHGDEILLPPGKSQIEPEAELGVVIGEQCRNVTAENALDIVNGYTCVDDLSNRDDQFAPEEGMDLFRGKVFDGAAPIGPAIAPPDKVPPDATIELRVNGDIRQHSSIDKLVFEIPELIERISSMVTLEPGDVISTGTPAGVAPVTDGDTVEIAIEGIGALTHTVQRV